MDLPNLKDLKAILKLCRAQGVTDLTLGELSIKFGEMPKTKEELEAETADVTTNPIMPSDEDMAFWSSQPDPLEAREAANQ